MKKTAIDERYGGGRVKRQRWRGRRRGKKGQDAEDGKRRRRGSNTSRIQKKR